MLRKSLTSSDLTILRISFPEALNVLALSDVSVAGSPRRLENLRNANRKSGTFKLRQSSRCIALVEEHVKRQTYDFLEDLSLSTSLSFESK